MNNLKAIVYSLRPYQWHKNAVLLAGVVFSRNFLNAGMVLKALGGAGVFCLAAGTGYLINDLCDRTRDRLNPVKRGRPVAAGTLSRSLGANVSVFLGVISILLGCAVNLEFGLAVGGYLVLMLLYSMILKKIPFLDAVVIASGFVIRAMAGAAAVKVPVSPWLVVCAFCASLFIALGKRYRDSVMHRTGQLESTAMAARYPLPLIRGSVIFSGAGAVLVYVLYTIASRTRLEFGSWHLVYSVPWVVLGVGRYLYLLIRKGAGGQPDKTLVTDPVMLIAILGWVVTCLVVIS